MADIEQRIIFDDSQALRTLDELANKTDSLDSKISKLGVTQTEGVKKFSKSLDDANKKITEQEKEIDELANSYATLVREQNESAQAGENLGKKQSAGSKLAVAGVKALTVGIQVLAATLGAAISQSDALATAQRKLTITYKALGSEIDTVVGFFKDNGFLGGIKEVSKEWRNLASNAASATQQMERQAAQMRTVALQTAKLNIVIASQAETQAALSRVIDDSNASAQERLKATTEYYDQENEQLTQRRDLIRDAINAENQYVDQSEQGRIEQRERVASLATELQNLNIAITDNDLARLDQLKAIRDKEFEELQSRLSNYAAFYDELVSIAGGGEGVDQRIAIEQKFIEETSALYAEFFSYTPEQQAKVKGNLDAAVKVLSEQRDAALAELNQPVDVPDFLPSAGAGVADTFTVDIPTPDLDTFRDRAEEVAKGVSAIADTIGSLTSAIGQAQVAAIDNALEGNARYIDSLRDRRDAVERTLEEEIEFRDQGLANAVDKNQQELDALQAQEARATTEREQLLAKRARAENANAKIQAVAQLAVAVTSIIASESSKGIIGLAIAAAAMPLLFALFTGSLKKAQSVEFYTGGKIGEGKAKWSHDRGGKGHRVENSNVVLGGDEFAVNGRSTSANEKFLHELNSGVYDHLDLSRVMNERFRKHDTTLTRAQNQVSAYQLEELSGSKKLLQFLKKQPQYYTYRKGDVVVKIVEDKTIKERK